MIAVREFTSAAECIAHAQAVHRKFFASPPSATKTFKPAPKKLEALFIPRFLHLTPSWKREHLYFDAHLIDWRLELSSRGSPVKAYIHRRIAELGFTHRDVMGENQSRALVAAKHLIWWEIKMVVKPSITLMEIARHFGAHHTTVLSGIRKVDAWKAAALEGAEP
jgi:hypothetical protein